MLTDYDIEIIGRIYDAIIRAFDSCLVGQKRVKDAVAISLLCSPNSRVLFVGGTGYGKSTLSNYVASSFKKERISIVNDMLESEIQNQLKDKKDMQFLQLEELNRASARVQNVFLELCAENQMTIDGEPKLFSDFFVFATQNSDDIAGIFNVSQAMYDRFDLYLKFEKLSEEDKRTLLFGNFKFSKEFKANLEHLQFVQNKIKDFSYDEDDENLFMEATGFIDDMQFGSQDLFTGSNMRGHFYLKKMAILSAIVTEGRNYILPSDIVKYIDYIYMHRINQNIANINDSRIKEAFENEKDKILSLKRSDGKR